MVVQSLSQTLFHAVAVTYSGRPLGKARLILGNVHSLRQMAHRRILGPDRARAIALLREFSAPWDQRWGSLIAIPLFLKEYPVSSNNSVAVAPDLYSATPTPTPTRWALLEGDEYFAVHQRDPSGARMVPLAA